MQVYAAVYCHGTGSVLVFRKKKEGFFFRRQLPSTGGQIRRGSKGGIVLNGGGSYCLPGGKLEAGESPERGALREFLEETGIDLGTYRQEIPPVRVEPSGSQRLYCGVVFCYGRIVFDAVYTAVAVKVEAKERALRRLFAETVKVKAKERELRRLFAGTGTPLDRIRRMQESGVRTQAEQESGTETPLDRIRRMQESGVRTQADQEIWNSWISATRDFMEDDELEKVFNIKVSDAGTYFVKNDRTTGWFWEICGDLEKSWQKQTGIISGFRTMPDFDSIKF